MRCSRSFRTGEISWCPCCRQYAPVAVFPGLAGQVAGKLGFAAAHLFGRVGRAALCSSYRRQHETGRFNKQIELAIEWWLHMLANPLRREILLNVRSLVTVLSYSDGEGDDGDSNGGHGNGGHGHGGDEGNDD